MVVASDKLTWKAWKAHAIHVVNLDAPRGETVTYRVPVGVMFAVVCRDSDTEKPIIARRGTFNISDEERMTVREFSD